MIELKNKETKEIQFKHFKKYHGYYDLFLAGLIIIYFMLSQGNLWVGILMIIVSFVYLFVGDEILIREQNEDTYN